MMKEKNIVLNPTALLIPKGLAKGTALASGIDNPTGGVCSTPPYISIPIYSDFWLIRLFSNPSKIGLGPMGAD